MPDNKGLGNAKNLKKDEFYTQLGDIENECKHYKEHFKNKTILCNCDDPYESNFFKYFAMNFNSFGLKKLIATCFVSSPIAGSQISLFDEETHTDKKPYKIEITEVNDETGDGAVNLADVEWLIKNKKNVLTQLKGNGDFLSAECIELLEEADIVVTNPPFSLFRQYVEQLVKYDKKFLIIGNQNAITYKEIFPLIKNNSIWLGYGFKGNVGFFASPYEDVAVSSQHKEGMIRISGVMWFTNLDIKKRHEELTLVDSYDPLKYPKYDNYNAINVDKTVDIPKDYDGLMGVPITFLDKYNPEQFEILGITDRQNTSGLRTKKYTSDDDKSFNDLNARGVLKLNGQYKSMYARILIRRK